MAKTSLHSFWLNLREEVLSPTITVQVDANVISALAARRTNAAMIRRKRNPVMPFNEQLVSFNGEKLSVLCQIPRLGIPCCMRDPHSRRAVAFAASGLGRSGITSSFWRRRQHRHFRIHQQKIMSGFSNKDRHIFEPNTGLQGCLLHLSIMSRGFVTKINTHVMPRLTQPRLNSPFLVHRSIY